MISIVAAADLPEARFRSLSDWASADAHGVSAGAPSVRPFPIPAGTGATAAVISSFDSATYGPQDQPEHHVTIFWEFRGGLFATSLLYPAHDSRGHEFERVLESNFGSIRPFPEPQKR